MVFGRLTRAPSFSGNLAGRSSLVLRLPFQLSVACSTGKALFPYCKRQKAGKRFSRTASDRKLESAFPVLQATESWKALFPYCKRRKAGREAWE